MISLVRLARSLLWAGIFVCSAAFADVPATLNYQGTLADSTGQPISGDKTVTFRLYSVPTGGTPFWTGQQVVTVRDGKLSVVLGANTANPLDPKKFTGETYIGVQVAPDAEMPRQKFTSVAYAFKAADTIPKGGIIMWSGDPAAIPAGWALCDGNNGAPDLRDRFVVGAGSGYTSGNTGGANSVDTNHAHSIAAESPGTSADGNHQHSININTSYPLQGDHTVNSDGSQHVADDLHSHNVNGLTEWAGSHSHTVNSHSHGGATGTAGSTALENRPPYYALAFIMKL